MSLDDDIRGFEERRPVIAMLIRTKAWRLMVILLAYMTGVVLMSPQLPTLMTNDFASRRAGQPIHCEDFPPPATPPPACQDAHSEVVIFATWSGFVQNTIISVMVGPALGAWSDVHGRIPFLLLAQALACIPFTVILLNLHFGTPLYWVYIVQAFTGSVSAITPSLAYIADIMPPQHRAVAFALIMASFALAVSFGPLIGVLLAPTTVPIVSLIIIVLSMIATVTLLPESLPPEAAAQAKLKQAACPHVNGPLSALASTFRALAILRRSDLFIRLTLVLMMGAVVSEGIQDILIQYLQLKMGFGPKDVSIMFMMLGLGGLLVQGFGLRTMLSLLGEVRLLVVGLAASAIEQLALAFATRKWQAQGAILIGAVATVTFPTVSSIKANNASADEQGQVQGAIAAARSLASGLGPLFFAALFAGFSRTDSPLPYFPGAPFILGAAMMVGTAALAATLPHDAGGTLGTMETFRSTRRVPMRHNEEGSVESRGSEGLERELDGLVCDDNGRERQSMQAN